jgi:hypothetical protein
MSTARKIQQPTHDESSVVANDIVTPSHPDVVVGRRVKLSIHNVHLTGTLGCDGAVWFLHDVRGFRGHYTQKLVRVGCESEIAKYTIAWDPCRDCGANGREPCDPTCRVGGGGR